MRIAIVCVNYNSYDSLTCYLQSIDKAASNVECGLIVDVIIADNSTTKELVDCSVYSNIRVKQIELQNLGYLGGAQTIINREENINQYQYVIISNVDLLLEKDTFKHLTELEIGDNVAWVAPSIYSEKYHKDLNPNILHRYKRWKLSLLKLTYNKLFYRLYIRLYFSGKDKNANYPEMEIYAGHGSIIILTSNFFRSYPKLDYPIFLYGEEVYLAELIYNKRMKVVYNPSIKIKTTGGVSTSKMPSNSFFKYNKEAINYILSKFY